VWFSGTCERARCHDEGASCDCAKFPNFSSHIFSRASLDFTVKFRVGHSVRENKLTVNNPLHSEEAVSMLPAELRTCRALLLLVIVGASSATIVALFLDNNRTGESNFRHPL
jgi:hypothetical protein